MECPSRRFIVGTTSLKLQASQFSKHNLIIGSLIVLDIIFIILYFWFADQTSLLNLDIERNIPTAYQSVKLVVTGALIAGLITLSFASKTRFRSYLLIPYCAIFIYLGIDEIGAIHESFEGVANRIGGDTVTQYREFYISSGYHAAQWLLYYTPIIVIAVAYLIYLVGYFREKKIKYLFLMAMGIALFSLVPVVEYYDSSSRETSGQANRSIVATEEFFEMLGASVFFAFNLLILRDEIKNFSRSPESEELKKHQS